MEMPPKTDAVILPRRLMIEQTVRYDQVEGIRQVGSVLELDGQRLSFRGNIPEAPVQPKEAL